MERGWHSNIDVKAISSLAGGFAYLKKYLLKNINAEDADPKALKTLALCWGYMKRAFSVSGQFRKMLSELIKQLRPRKTSQTTLYGDAIEEEKFHVIGFVPADILSFKREVWFSKLEGKVLE